MYAGRLAFLLMINSCCASLRIQIMEIPLQQLLRRLSACCARTICSARGFLFRKHIYSLVSFSTHVVIIEETTVWRTGSGSDQIERYAFFGYQSWIQSLNIWWGICTDGQADGARRDIKPKKNYDRLHWYTDWIAGNGKTWETKQNQAASNEIL